MKYNKNKYFDKGGYGNNKTKYPEKRPENEPLEIIHYIPVEYYHDPNAFHDPNMVHHEEYYDPNMIYQEEYYDPNMIQHERHFDPNMVHHGRYIHPNEQYFPPDYYHQPEIDTETPRKRQGKQIIHTNKKILEDNRPLVDYTHKIDNLDDLINLSYDVEKKDFFNISLNQEHLLNLREPLVKLKNLIGMESIKKNIFNQLIFFLQNIEPQFPHMLHTCIEGPPGCGKTELANILAQIYANLGIIQESKVVIARRSDLVAGFLGQTAQKTQDMIDSAKGGVLLIDEAYSLGNEDKKDSFAKECIDTLNQNLTEGKGDFICIIAGYKEDLEKSFFGFNSGLERRFPYRFSIDEYTPEQLCKIYQFILEKNGWKLDNSKENELVDFLSNHRENFKFNGGDLENLVHFSKLAYAKNRVFNTKNQDKIINLDDVKKAYEMYISNKKKDNKIIIDTPLNMYI